MTVLEQIDALGRYPPALRVAVDGYENGYDDLSPDRMPLKQISLNTGTESWAGWHGDPESSSRRKQSTAETVEALVLRRASG